MTEILNSYFISACTKRKDGASISANENTVEDKHRLNKLIKRYHSLAAIKVNRSSGPDGMRHWLLRNNLQRP